MKFLLFIKQVPETADIRFDPETKRLVREGVRSGINAYDRRAISEAVRYCKEYGGEVVVATMGPRSARTALAEAIVMGADRAVHMEDARLAGSDTLATARVLAAAARKIGYDIIFTGQHSTDSETGQVPPALAELLGVPCAVAVRNVQYTEYALQVLCETDDGTMLLDIPLPAVLSAAERLIKPIKVKDFDPASVSGDRIETMRLEDLDLEETEVGEPGSPTRVAGIREQLIWRTPETLDGTNASAAARRIVEEIASSVKQPLLPEVPGVLISADREFWCVMERRAGAFSVVSLEILSAAAALAAQRGGTVCAITWGAPPSPGDAALLSSWGADRIYRASLRTGHPDEVVALLCDRIVAQRPFALFLPSSSAGRAIAPRVAARLGLGLTGDCVGLSLDTEGNLQQLKPAFGGNIVAPIYSRTYPQMATIRPGSLPAYRPRPARLIPQTDWSLPYNVVLQYRILEEDTDPGADAVKLNHARFVVCAGMGLGQNNVPLAARLADAFHGALGATRRVVDAGWLQRQYQVGLTGKFIAPAVHIGLGVSGRYNHTIGIQKSGKIIAINNDPGAEISRAADLFVVGDCVAIAQAILDLANR